MIDIKLIVGGRHSATSTGINNVKTGCLMDYIMIAIIDTTAVVRIYYHYTPNSNYIIVIIIFIP